MISEMQSMNKANRANKPENMQNPFMSRIRCK